MSDSLCIFLHSSEYDRVYQAVNIVHTGSAMGKHCHLFLFYQALGSYLEGNWDEVDIAHPTLKRSFEMADTPSLYALLERAKQETGGLTVCACSTSVRFLEKEPSVVKEKVDEIVGLSTILQIASQSGQVLYI